MKELTIKQLRLLTRLTQRDFAEKFDIPLKTLQKWEQGTSKPASYIPEMIYTILLMELKLNTFYPHMNCMACDSEGMCIIENAVCNLHTCIHKNYEDLAELEEDYAAMDLKEGDEE